MTEIALNGKEFRTKLSMDITDLWRAKKWNDNQLLYYITQRFGRPIEQLSLAELRVIKDELV